MLIHGCGLPKTGTTSLHRALKQLGFKSAQNPLGKQRKTMFEGCYSHVFDDCDAVVNAYEWDFYMLYETFKDRDIRFIYTSRNIDDWLKSCKNHFSFPKKNQNRLNDIYVFGNAIYNESKFRYIYNLHYQIIHNFFADKPEIFLSIDICSDSNDKWDRICKFLDRPIVTSPFPKANRTTQRRQKWFRKRALKAGYKDGKKQ